MRPETGPMKFGNDWTGMFIRGDNCHHLLVNLQILLEKPDDPLARMITKEFIEDLAMTTENKSSPTKLKNFEDCIEKKDK